MPRRIKLPGLPVELSVQANIGRADVERSGRSQKLNKIFEKLGM